MTLHVVGGVYREFCVHPRWNEIFGSAGRAAIAVAMMESPVVLHAYMDSQSQEVISEKAAWLSCFTCLPTEIPVAVGFEYFHDLAVPAITGVPSEPYPSIRVSEEKVIRFGMLEGEAIVDAEWAVYDPQNVDRCEPFGANGSRAKHLALVLNAWEARYLSGLPDALPEEMAAALAKQQGAEVVVIKMGPRGAFVSTPEGVTVVPAFKTSNVWKIGSGDCFVAHFANAWMQDGASPLQAAETASRATAYYCETQGLPSRHALAADRRDAIQPSASYIAMARRKVYLAGPFFDLAQVWLVQEARSELLAMGLDVFSPYHDVGLGCASDVVTKDLDGIEECDLMLAITDGLDSGTLFEIGYARKAGKPVVVYSERHMGESLKMMEGSGCVLCNSFTTALYATLWKAVEL